MGGATRATTSFDVLGRTLGHAEYDAYGTVVHERSAIVYDARGQVLSEKGRTRQGADWLYTHTVNHYSADGAGADQPAISWSGSSGSSSGTLLYYSETKNWKNGSNPPAYLSSADYAYADAYTRQSYRWREGAQQSYVRLVNRDGTSTSAYGYDNSGDLASVTIAGGARPRTIAYTHTAAGQVLSRRETDRNYSQNDPSQRSYVRGFAIRAEVRNGSFNWRQHQLGAIICARKPFRRN